MQRVRNVVFYLLWIAVATMLGGCATGRPDAEPVDTQVGGLEQPTRPTVEDRLSQNRLVAFGTGLSLPQNWRALLAPEDAVPETRLRFVNVGEPNSTGSYMAYDADRVLSASDVAYVYAQTRLAGWHIVESGMAGDMSMAGVHRVAALDRQAAARRRALAYILVTDRTVHLLEFDTPAGAAEAEVLQEYVDLGFSRAPEGASARLLPNGLGFVAAGSGFVWRSDTVSGFVLSGRACGAPALVEVELPSQAVGYTDGSDARSIEVAIGRGYATVSVAALADDRPGVRFVCTVPFGQKERVAAAKLVFDFGNTDVLMDDFVTDPAVRTLLGRELIASREVVR